MFLDGVLMVEQDIGVVFNYVYVFYIYLGIICDFVFFFWKGQDIFKGQLDEIWLINGVVRYDVDFVVFESKLFWKVFVDF